MLGKLTQGKNIKNNNSLAKIKFSLYNDKRNKIFLYLYGEQLLIKSYEPCQVGNEAAISSRLCGGCFPYRYKIF